MEVDPLLMDQLRVETCSGSFGTNGTGLCVYQWREKQRLRLTQRNTERHRGSRRRSPGSGRGFAGAKEGDFGTYGTGLQALRTAKEIDVVATALWAVSEERDTRRDFGVARETAHRAVATTVSLCGLLCF
jgi:hypothetical protein